MPDTTVVIAVVRPALLGTYGDGGNALVLEARLRRRGIPTEVVEVGGTTPVPRSSDLLVLGGGEDEVQRAVADDDVLRRSVVGAVDAGAVVLAVCGGFQLLGSQFVVGDGRTVAGYDIVDCVTDRLAHRAVGEVVADCLLPGVPALTGFENHGGRTTLGPGAAPLGVVRVGVGNGTSGGEGATAGRIVATYLHGPVLARNPALADHLLELAVGPLDPLTDGPVTRLRRERLRAASRWRRHRRG